MKKAASIGFLAMWIVGSVLVVFVVPSINVSGMGDPVDMGGYYVTPGDWTVDAGSQMSYSDTTIIVNGHLTITAPYTLQLSNVELLMNSSHNGEFNITVENGAGIEITNGCNITSYTPDGNHRFGFVVDGPGGSIIMTDSELHQCGWGGSEPDYSDRGLNIRGGNAVITGNEISDNFFGMILYGVGATGATISGNHIHNNTSGTAVCILSDSSDITVVDNDINDNYNGIYIDGTATDNIDINGNTILRNTRGIYIISTTNTEVTQNVVEFNTEYGILADSSTNLLIDGNFVNNTWNGVSYPNEEGTGIKVDTGTNTTISNNHANFNANTGIAAFNSEANTTFINNFVGNTSHFGLADVYDISGEGWMENNHVDSSGFGLFVQGSQGVRVTNNLIESCGGIGFWMNAGGINSYESNDLYYENNVVSECAGGLTFAINGHIMTNVDGIVVEGDTYEYNENNLHIGDQSSNILVKNSTLKQDFDTTWDVLVADDTLAEDDAHVTLLNTTYDETKIEVGDLSTNASLTVKWFLHVKVVVGGSGQDGVDVYVFNVTDDEDPGSGQPFATSEGGYVKFIPTTWFTDGGNTRDYFSSHTILAKTPDMEGRAYPFMDQTSWVEVQLNMRPMVVNTIPADGAMVEVLRTDTLMIQVNGQDQEDSEDDLTPYIQYRSNDTEPWTYGNYLANGSISYVGSPPGGHFEIAFTPPTTASTGLYDIRMMFEDTYGLFSEWFYANISIDVTNNVPYVETPFNESSTVFRGDVIDIWADGDDVEDGDDQNFDSPAADAIFEYRAPSGSWETVYISAGPYQDGVDWRAAFSPPAAPTKAEVGFYDFRFKFIDNDGDGSEWVYMYDWIEVLNNPPAVQNLVGGHASIYRENEDTWVFVNVTEVEDQESDMVVIFSYLEPSVGWSSSYLPGQTKSYDPAGFWKQRFDPPATAEPGLYNFKVTVTDTDGGVAELMIPSLIEVKNNLPQAIDLTPSVTKIRAGSSTPVYLQVNGWDEEDQESELDIELGNIWWQYNGEDGTMVGGPWQSSYFGASGYDPEGGFLTMEFLPPSDAEPGWYGFRVIVTDGDGGESNQIEELALIEVVSPDPTIESLSLETPAEVFRGEQMVITLDGSDALDAEEELVPHVEIKYKEEAGSPWVELTGTPVYEGGSWEVPWTPGTGMDIGDYWVRGRFENSEDAFSNYLGDTTGPDQFIVMVKNNKPVAINIGIADTAESVDRVDSITIYANGNDVETSENQLLAFFEYSDSSGDWDDTYFSDPTFNVANSRWEIDFEPDRDAELGVYSFRVYFRDGDNLDSDNITSTDLLVVNNMNPVVTDLTVPVSSHRGETVTIFANGEDGDGDESTLTPTFQYKPPIGAWSELPASPIYVSNMWRITWTPDVEEEIGTYGFRVRFSDGDDDSEWLEDTTTFTLLNVPPSADDLTVPGTVYRLETLYITANGSDVDGSEESLTPEFQYKGPTGGWISHGESGSYFTGNAQYSNGFWQIGFKTAAGGELGQYSFRVRFFDDDDNSSWLEGGTTLTVVANPEDPDDDGSLNPDDLDDDGDNVPDNDDDFPLDPAASTDTDGDGKPDTWNYGKSASDSTTGLVIDDDDDGDGVNDSEDPEPLDPSKSGKEEEEVPVWFRWIALLLVIIIILLALIFTWLVKGRTKAEEIPQSLEDEESIEQEVPEEKEGGDPLEEDEHPEGDEPREDEVPPDEGESPPSDTDDLDSEEEENKGT